MKGLLRSIGMVLVFSFVYVGNSLAEEPKKNGENFDNIIIETPAKPLEIQKVEEPIVPAKVEKSTSVVTVEDDILHVSDVMNLRTYQFYIGIKGGGHLAGHIGTTSAGRDYLAVGIAPLVGGTIGVGFQIVPNFGIRLGVNIEHLFTTNLQTFEIASNSSDKELISFGQQNFERTSVLGDIYFDFRQGIWSSFYLNLSAGYSWIVFEGVKDTAVTAGLGLGVRWFAHKYVTLDWTILNARATFAKEIIPEVGTTIGITFQY